MPPVRGSMSADVVLSAARGHITGISPRPGITDYNSTEQRFTRQADFVGQSPWPPLVLGVRGFYPLLDVQSTLARGGHLTGPWQGVRPQSRTRLGTAMNPAQMAKVPN